MELLQLVVIFALGAEFAFSQSTENIRTLKAKNVIKHIHDSLKQEGTSSNPILLSEPGYHWCPSWADGSWCPEGYLCGDGNNGCAFGRCCDDDPSTPICENHSSNGESDFTPCGANSNANPGAYHCCDITQICGDGSDCTSNCPKGECCDFNPNNVRAECGYSPGANDDPCPVGVSPECCTAKDGWDLDNNRMVDESWADYYKSNDQCWDGEVYTIEDESVVIDCNYALGSYEYICQHEGGAICSLTIDLEETYEGGSYHIDFTFYHCIAMQCDNDVDEDAIEDHLEREFFNWTEELGQPQLTVDCDSLHCECDASENGGATSDRCDGVGRCDCKYNWKGDHCDECKTGYGPPGNCTTCSTGYHMSNGICCPQYTANVKGSCKDQSSCLGVKMHVANRTDYCESLFREPCTEKTPIDTCGECADGYSTDGSVPLKPINSVCFPNKLLSDAAQVNHARDSMDDVSIIVLTIFVTLLFVAIGFVVWYFLIKPKKQTPDVKDFYKSAGKRLVEEEPSVTEDLGDQDQQELVSVGPRSDDPGDSARM